MHIQDLCVSRDGVSLISHASFTLAPGSVAVLSGANGAGKSSLVYAIMGHPKYAITQGTIRIDGSDLTHAAPEVRARAGLFLALQQPIPLPGISWYALLKESYQAIKGAHCSAEQFQQVVFPLMDALELDHAWLSRQVHEGFSGGERKRFEVLHALLVRPKVLMLDEVDSGLDAHSVDLVGKALASFMRANQTSSLFIITHTRSLLSYLTPTVFYHMQAGTLHEGHDKQ